MANKENPKTAPDQLSDAKESPGPYPASKAPPEPCI